MAATESKMKTVFESTSKRPLDKRKKKKNNDPSDVEGFLGPWASFVDEKRVAKPGAVMLLPSIIVLNYI